MKLLTTLALLLTFAAANNTYPAQADMIRGSKTIIKMDFQYIGEPLQILRMEKDRTLTIQVGELFFTVNPHPDLIEGTLWNAYIEGNSVCAADSDTCLEVLAWG